MLSKRFKLNTIRNLFVAGLLLTGCAIINNPINVVMRDGTNLTAKDLAGDVLVDDSLFIGLAFSGGGMRASAFAHGMLEALQSVGQSPSNPNGLLEHVRLVSGVSGGAVTAANFGYYGPAGIADYREKFLIQNAEKYMANSVWNPITVVRGISGGANGRRTFGRFLDESLFHGATFGDLARKSNIITWINASDIANRTSFLFSPETFDALCSDLSKLPLSEAVAASAAFPGAFSPIVLEAHTEKCDYTEPDWLTTARFNPEATATLRAYGKELENYATPGKVRYVKLLDGGITDNFGTIALSVARARARTPYGPISAEQAVRLNRFMFLVANAGVEADPKWTKRLKGPGGTALGVAIINSSMASATRTAYDAMRLSLSEWHRDMIEYRCRLPLSEVRRLRGNLTGWDCRNVKLFISEVSFDGLDPDMQIRLNEIPTRLRLETDQVDLVINAGREATRMNIEFNGFLRSIGIGSSPAAGARRISPVSN